VYFLIVSCALAHVFVYTLFGGADAGDGKHPPAPTPPLAIMLILIPYELVPPQGPEPVHLVRRSNLRLRDEASGFRIVREIHPVQGGHLHPHRAVGDLGTVVAAVRRPVGVHVFVHVVPEDCLCLGDGFFASCAVGGGLLVGGGFSFFASGGGLLGFSFAF